MGAFSTVFDIGGWFFACRDLLRIQYHFWGPFWYLTIGCGAERGLVDKMVNFAPIELIFCVQQYFRDWLPVYGVLTSFRQKWGSFITKVQWKNHEKIKIVNVGPIWPIFCVQWFFWKWKPIVAFSGQFGQNWGTFTTKVKLRTMKKIKILNFGPIDQKMPQ